MACKCNANNFDGLALIPSSMSLQVCIHTLWGFPEKSPLTVEMQSAHHVNVSMSGANLEQQICSSNQYCTGLNRMQLRDTVVSLE